MCDVIEEILVWWEAPFHCFIGLGGFGAISIGPLNMIILPFDSDGNVDFSGIGHAYAEYDQNNNLRLVVVMKTGGTQSEPLHWGKINVLAAGLGYSINLKNSTAIKPLGLAENDEYKGGWTRQDELKYQDEMRAQELMQLDSTFTEKSEKGKKFDPLKKG